MVIWRQFQVLSFKLGAKPPHAEVNGKSQLPYESNQHPLVCKKKMSQLLNYSISTWWSQSCFPDYVIHRLSFSKIKKENGKSNINYKFYRCWGIWSCQCGSIAEGGLGTVGQSKATQGKERAKLSTGPGRVRGNRQNIWPSVIGASHGYRSEHSTGGASG